MALGPTGNWNPASIKEENYLRITFLLRSGSSLQNLGQGSVSEMLLLKERLNPIRHLAEGGQESGSRLN
jgi:hypothetical protein